MVLKTSQHRLSFINLINKTKLKGLSFPFSPTKTFITLFIHKNTAHLYQDNHISISRVNNGPVAQLGFCRM